ncbi:MAG: mucoidy inhibitor MuiA family protein [Candidatus Omnitrophica bacterium]|nr:mucoidy inhibitor MuiA family protein [Candidatus Omnitrophota bacterium]MDD5238516.1 mucoidy inhibitor MuiA family protein [Candidatus Omnitrophota bacterium]
MKKIAIWILAFSFFIPLPCVFSAEIMADSKITQVSVYPDSSLITRTVSLKLSPGEYQVIFANIIPEVDENSLRVSAVPAEGTKILGGVVKKEFLKEEASEKVKQLQEEIQKLQDEKRKLEDTKRVLTQEKEYLDSVRLFANGQIPKDLVTKMPQAKDLDETLKFLGTRLKENYNNVLDAEINIRDIEKKIIMTSRELAQVSGHMQKLKRLIQVDLEVLRPANFDLNVSYLVRGASWYPIYDARANFEKNEVELISYGIVRQTTGEDWNDVDIFLSTAKPAIGGRMPYVNPWILRPYQPQERKKRDHKMMRELSQTMAFKDEASAEMNEVRGSLALTERPEPYSQVEEKGIAVVYKLAKKADIKADGSEHKLPISTQVLPAKFEYSTYPRVIVHAYLGSRVSNAPNLQLLAGRVNVFLNGDFVGTSGIDNVGPGEEFDLYLGADENVKVKREQIEKKVDETLIAGIPSSTKRISFKYKLTVENYKSKKIGVKLFEAMPVSEDDRIKVKITSVSLEPKEKDWEDRKGIWRWELDLEPKAKSEIIYSFVIEHPREMAIEGL